MIYELKTINNKAMWLKDGLYLYDFETGLQSVREAAKRRENQVIVLIA